MLNYVYILLYAYVYMHIGVFWLEFAFCPTLSGGRYEILDGWAIIQGH